MTVKNPPPEFVIRFGDVALDRHELKNALGIELDRYEPSRDGLSHYAQISMNGDVGQWSLIADFLDAVGPRIKDLIDRKLIGSVAMDFAIHFPDNIYAISPTVPATVAFRAGLNLIDIEMSVYRSQSDD